MSTPTNVEYRDTILKATNVSLVLGKNVILRDVNLEIRDIYRPGLITGQVVGVLGPSGIGKTRLFRVLSGIDAPNTGTVTIGADAKPVKRGMVGVIAQNYPLFEHRTVLGNLQLAARCAGLCREDAVKKALSFLDRFGMEDRGDLYPCQLSGGQRQRVAIAQQFLCSEHFVLMDEPFSGLDLIAVDKVCKMIAEVANQDELNTVIVVTHDIAAAVAVADTIWLLGRDRDHEGHIIPGARIKATYNLIERGLAWTPGITETKEFIDVVCEIRAVFPSL
jgi:polar amino acid transport system ATP-binding protein/sulfate transport system ATP-binding protein